MSKARDPLSGVKTTRKRVAEKEELLMQVLSEFDSNMRMAEVNGRMADSTASRSESGDIMSERRIVVVLRWVEVVVGFQESSYEERSSGTDQTSGWHRDRDCTECKE
jgi:hypothetical protein